MIRGKGELAAMECHSRKPIAIDLFCGAGGLSEGLSQAGFDPRVAVDFDTNALKTYKANHPQTEIIDGDIANVTGAELMRLARTSEIDLVAGGPSCQGFSTHGKRIQDDPRNFLFKHFVRIVDEVRPKMFLMENVKGMLTYSKGYFRKQIEEAFKEIGYHCAFTTVCAADFGVPQLRHRVLFIGTRLDQVPLSFPKPTHGDRVPGLKPYLTVADAIGDLPRLKRDYKNDMREYACAPQNPYQFYLRAGAGKKLTMHVSAPLSDQAQRLAEHIGQGEGLRAVPVRNLPARFRKMRTISTGALRRDCTTLYYRLDPKRPSYTITCYYKNVASGPFLHPYEDRSLSHREAARLMSFPDRYKFEGTTFTRQIGNAVPVLMAKAIGEEILRSLGVIEQRIIKHRKAA
jgi:DNA (cytosine-5)-methyltransferase 1